MPDFMLRDIPNELWERFKDRAQREKWHVPSLLRQLVTDYAAGRIAASQAPSSNPVRDQYLPIFGKAYNALRREEDWWKLTDRERGQRLKEKMAAEDRTYGRPSRFPADFDFVMVAQRLGLPDIGKIPFVNHCPNGHATGLSFSEGELRDDLAQHRLTLYCIICDESRPPTSVQRAALEESLRRSAKRRL